MDEMTKATEQKRLTAEERERIGQRLAAFCEPTSAEAREAIMQKLRATWKASDELVAQVSHDKQ